LVCNLNPIFVCSNNYANIVLANLRSSAQVADSYTSVGRVFFDMEN